MAHQIHYTNRVVTLWYRAPELLLGSNNYGLEIDMWSVGCFFVELLTRSALFPGKNENHQLDLIFQKLGKPTEETWPGVSNLKNFSELKDQADYRNCLRPYIQATMKSPLDDITYDLIERMLSLDPAKRISAADALEHPYFSTEPLPCEPAEIPRIEGESHELTVRRERKQAKR